MNVIALKAILVTSLSVHGGWAPGLNVNPGITLTYLCGNTFRVRNSAPEQLVVKWEVQGRGERGTLRLPPKPANAPFSETLLTTLHAGTLRLSSLGRALQTRTNRGIRPCKISAVPSLPPDTVPSWFRDDSSYTDSKSYGRFLRGVISVEFVQGATPRQREEAVLATHGQVIGGAVGADGDGIYFVWTDDNGTGTALERMAARLKAFRQVRDADFVGPGSTPL